MNQTRLNQSSSATAPASEEKSSRSKMFSAAQIRAFNETLQLLIVFVILFKDWPTRLIAIIALILIHRRSKMI
jgi:hypothetical protein